MRFMMIVKANEASEAGAMPGEPILAAMAKYNEELAKAGVLLDLAGLHPTSNGARVKFSAGRPRVIDGPFTEAKELIGGYWVIQVKSREEAIEWAKRVPFGVDPQSADNEIEIRQVFELDDFAPSAAIDEHRKLERKLAEKK